MKFTFCLVFLNVVLGLDVISYNSYDLDPDEYKLELAQVLFRHGERTPREQEIYKNDPYQMAYSKIGYGVLTNSGKERMFQLGYYLRELYSDFIGKNETEKVLAYHTGWNRTEASLRLVLAGLFPSINLIFATEEKHRSSLTLHNDSLNFLRAGLVGKCSSQYLGMIEQNLNKIVKELKDKDFKNFDIKLVANLTGVPPTPLAMVWLSPNLKATGRLGFPKPEWCSKVDCSYIEKFSKLFVKCMGSNDWMKRITGGVLLQRFLKNMETRDNDEKRLHLYSAHDIQLMALVQTLGLENAPELPDYGSCIRIEKLRKKDGRLYVRMIMRTGEQIPRTIPLKLLGCNVYCPLEIFAASVRPYFPSEGDWNCPKSSSKDVNIDSYSLSRN
ncbi:hypothetical protein QAD02_005894 [Eretmocerus hayati]|uniref:Uncharacterized protein n=1 Tax=Eretmocerus hayati TaxID=131215 RepID=A0ACC2MZP7_9HYME|nr:hypothetical protein QAD02_005894 [Eretmocerus hayati]